MKDILIILHENVFLSLTSFCVEHSGFCGVSVPLRMSELLWRFHVFKGKQQLPPFLPHFTLHLYFFGGGGVVRLFADDVALYFTDRC